MEPERSGRKENSSRGSRRHLWAHSRYRVNTRIVSAVPQPGSGIGTGFPFARRTGFIAPTGSLQNGTLLQKSALRWKEGN
jgi:hypothetical protein